MHVRTILRFQNSNYPSMRSKVPYIIALWLTGARPGEIANLPWDSVSSDCSRALLYKHKTAEKIGKPRKIVFPACMETLVKISKHFKQGEYVFYSKGEPICIESIGQTLRRMIKKEGSGLNLYQYRHGFVTRAIVNKVDPLTIAELVGHSSLAMINSYYAHLDQEEQHLLDAVNKVNKQ